MSTSVNSVTNHFPSAENGFTTTTAGSVSSGATTVTLNSVAGYDNGEVVVFIIDPDNDKKQAFTGVVDTAGVQITSVVWTAGTNQTHTLGATVVDYATATHISMISKGLMVQHKQSGAHADTITTNTINENTPANGVTIDGVNIKDGALNTNNSVVTANITDDAVTSAKVSGIAKDNLTTDSNPYKFHAYRNAAWTATSWSKVTLDTEYFDTNSNFDTSTGRYTAPVDGFYQICWGIHSATTAGIGYYSALYKNGAQIARGSAHIAPYTNGSNWNGSRGTGLFQLTAGQYLELYHVGGSNTGGTGYVTFMSGFLVSRT